MKRISENYVIILALIVIMFAVTMPTDAKRVSKMSRGKKPGKSGKKGGKDQNSIEEDNSDDFFEDESFPDEFQNDEAVLDALKMEAQAPVRDLDLKDLDLAQGQQEILGRVVELTERIVALQHTMTNIKLQNHYIYRSMKRNYKMCKTGGGGGGTKESSSPNDVIQTAAQTMEKPVCPPDYTENPNTNTCYRMRTERISWRMARERCRHDDADLVSIETKQEQRWISQQARHNPDTRHCDFWTGGSDKKSEGDWRWVANNNALSYSNWNHDEPNNGRDNGEHCLQMLWVFNWAWNDAHCEGHNACFICETGKRRPDARL